MAEGKRCLTGREFRFKFDHVLIISRLKNYVQHIRKGRRRCSPTMSRWITYV